MLETFIPLAAISGILMGLIVGYFSKKYIDSIKLESTDDIVKRIRIDAEREAEVLKREAVFDAKDALLEERKNFEKDNRQKRNELKALENRLLKKEDMLEKRIESIEKKEQQVVSFENSMREKDKHLGNLMSRYREELEHLSGMSVEEAKNILIRSLEDDARKEAIQSIKRLEEEFKKTSAEKSKEIIATALQKSAVEFVSSMAVTVVDLPSDDMKGRLIGREGRNIREFEKSTGVDLIIDDTPEAVLISSFDPLRREVAKRSLEKLIADGRIHPSRIEEIVQFVKKELEDNIVEEGEQAAFELGIHNLSSEQIRFLGRLKFIHSYGQNVLQHSTEVSIIAEAIAFELGANSNVVKRAGLLHDLGKAASHELEGSHDEVSAELARKYNESEAVIQAISAHHGAAPPRTLEAVILRIADTISEARPGAQKTNLDIYIRRMEKLEKIAKSHEGVLRAYALQTGRELRVIVNHSLISDEDAYALSKLIANDIEEKLEYPGQIKVTVYRETRIVEYAR